MPAGSGLYKIVHTPSGRVLAVKDAATSNGAPAVIVDDSERGGAALAARPRWQGQRASGQLRDRKDARRSEHEQETMERRSSNGPTARRRPTAVPNGARQPGKIGTALDFCKTASYGSLPSGIVSSLNGDWSISTWIKPAALSNWSRVFDFGTGQNVNMFLTLNAGGAGPRFAITNSGAGAEQRLTYGGQNFPLNQWSNVVVTVSGTTRARCTSTEPLSRRTAT